MGEFITEETLEVFKSLLQCGLANGKIYADFSSDDLVLR